METKANYVLIGAFTLAGFLGIMAMFLWFARVELDQQYAYYDIRFSSVSGLSDASDVRFSGLPVGQVVDVRLSPDLDGTILVRVEIDAATPVRTDSVATIEAQGVTGVAFVSIGPGTPSTPLLNTTNTGEVPEITAGRSVLQSLSEDAPELVNETLTVMNEMGDLFGADNQQRVERILQNVEDASGSFSETLDNFSMVAGSVTDFATQIGTFSEIMTQLSDDIAAVLQTADSTLSEFAMLFDDAEAMLASGNTALTAAQNTAESIDRYVTTDLSAATSDLQTTLQTLRTDVATISDDARALMATFSTTGTTATARLTEAEATLAAADALIGRLDTTTETINRAVTQFEALLTNDATPLVTETRTAVAEATDVIRTVGRSAEEDLPAIMTDIRQATETIAQVVTDVGADLSSAGARIDGLSTSAEVAIEQATLTFRNANTTLAAITQTMETSNRALASADSAFSGADRLINEDLNGLINGFQTSIASLNEAISQVSSDLPLISSDLRSASQSAEDAFATLKHSIDAAGPAIADFSQSGLPQYTRLAQELRDLTNNLDRLTQQIQRDPARFFLDRQTPEFQR